MADGLDEPNQLPLVCSELRVMWRDWSGEEGNRPGTLKQDRPNARARRVAIDNEGPGEIW
jgi:hypothetical protein